MKKQLVAFVAGAYRSKKGIFEIKKNIDAAEAIGAELLKMGYAVIMPQKNTAFMDGVVPDRMILDSYLTILVRCDVVVMREGWGYSAGSIDEHETAEAHGKLICYWPKDRATLEKLVKENGYGDIE